MWGKPHDWSAAKKTVGITPTHVGKASSYKESGDIE